MNGSTMRSMPEEIRPYERAEKLGAEKLSDAELVSILLRSGSRGKTALETAQRLLTNAGGLNGIRDRSVEELTEFDGIGKVKALGIKAALELGDRVSREKKITHSKTRSVEEFVDLYRSDMIGPREKFRVVLLNNRSVIIRDETISTGNHNMTLVDPREVFIAALRGRAAGILVMHNHPSGDPEPGHEDIETTKRLLKAGEILGIKLYDHIIFGGDAYYSFYEQGMMDKIRSEER